MLLLLLKSQDQLESIAEFLLSLLSPPFRRKLAPVSWLTGNWQAGTEWKRDLTTGLGASIYFNSFEQKETINSSAVSDL
jgi:hypothetical protein